MKTINVYYLFIYLFIYSLQFAYSCIQYVDPKTILIKETAKAVAAVWGTEFIKFLAALAVLHQDELDRMNSSCSSYPPGAKQHARQKVYLIYSVPQTSAMAVAFSSL